MRREEPAMNRTRRWFRRAGYVHVGRRPGAVLGAEVIARWIEVFDHRGRGAETQVYFTQCIVIDRIEVDVLVAPALAGSGVGLVAKIELGSRITLGLRGRGRWFRRRNGWRWGRCRLPQHERGGEQRKRDECR